MTQSVYFSKLQLNKQKIELPAKAGWIKSGNLRMIHALRYKPYCKSESATTMFQAELLNEHSNERLASVADGFLAAISEFQVGDKVIHSGCHITARNRHLREVTHEPSPKVKWENYEDCLSYFYPGNRTYTEPLILSRFDKEDITRGEGWYHSTNAKLFEPYQIVKQMDYMLLAHTVHKAEGKEFSQESIDRGNEFFEAFNEVGLKLKMKYLGDLKWKFFVNQKELFNLDFNLRETVSFALDFYMRLVAVGRNLKSSAICLIENSTALNSDILKNIFPKVQFIVN